MFPGVGADGMEQGMMEKTMGLEPPTEGAVEAASLVRMIDLRGSDRKVREAVRARAYGLFRQGAGVCEAARILEVQTVTVSRWFRAFRTVDCAMPEGERRQGGARSILSPGRMEELRQALLDKEPLDFSLPYRRWSYAAVAELVEAKFGLKVSRVTAGKWLAMCRGGR